MTVKINIDLPNMRAEFVTKAGSIGEAAGWLYETQPKVYQKAERLEFVLQ